MEEQIRDVLRPGIHSVKLDVEHVRQPGHRMPVGCIRGRQSPLRALPCQPSGNMDIIKDVFRIVPHYESEIAYRGVYGYTRRNQNQARKEDKFREERIRAYG